MTLVLRWRRLTMGRGDCMDVGGQFKRDDFITCMFSPRCAKMRKGVGHARKGDSKAVS